MSALGLVWANLQRRKIRTYLTVFSLLVAFLLFTVLRTVAVWFEQGIGDTGGVDRLVVTAKYSIIESLPVSQRGQILAVDGVEAITHMTWFGGNYQDPRNFFPKYPVEPLGYFEMFPEYIIDPDQLNAFANTRTGAVAPAGMLEQYGWQVGDKIPIEADIYPMRDGSRLWEFDLVGSYTTEAEGGPPPVFLFHYDYFDEARQFGQGSVGWWTVRISDPERAPEISSTIDTLFENSLNPVKSATEDEFGRQFAAQIGDIGLITTGILSAVFFTILLLTANTMSQALRERIPELAVLKTLGFSDLKVAMIVLAESVLLCALGGLLGIALAVLAAPGINQAMAVAGLGLFIIGWEVPAIAAGLAVLLGIAVGASPAWSANRLSIADALRRS